MLLVPLAALLRDMPNNVLFKVSMITIIGLLAKNLTLIMEFARQLHEYGKGTSEATFEAVSMRLHWYGRIREYDQRHSAGNFLRAFFLFWRHESCRQIQPSKSSVIRQCVPYGAPFPPRSADFAMIDEMSEKYTHSPFYP